MSQRKQTYTSQQLIDELLKMDAQIIHGTDIFRQAAETIQAVEKENSELREHLANVNRDNQDNKKAFENEYANHRDTTKDRDRLRSILQEISKGIGFEMD